VILAALLIESFDDLFHCRTLHVCEDRTAPRLYKVELLETNRGDKSAKTCTDLVELRLVHEAPHGSGKGGGPSGARDRDNATGWVALVALVVCTRGSIVALEVKGHGGDRS
jgi:hypothetical protein